MFLALIITVYVDKRPLFPTETKFCFLSLTLLLLLAWAMEHGSISKTKNNQEKFIFIFFLYILHCQCPCFLVKIVPTLFFSEVVEVFSLRLAKFCSEDFLYFEHRFCYYQNFYSFYFQYYDELFCRQVVELLESC